MNKTSGETKMVAGSTLLGTDDFFCGILAALRVNGHKQIIAARFHRAFYRTLKKLDGPEFTDAIMVNTSGIDFDSLYGLSEWLVCALARARRDFLIRFRSSFHGDLIEINLEEDRSEKMLSGFGCRETLLKLATLLHVELAFS